jgi:lipopolysaccharide biosynthesis protein
VFQSEPFRDFMAGIVRQNDVMNVIVNYEIGLSRLLLSCGFKVAALVEDADDWRENKTLEPVKLMREFGMPLVKKKCFSGEHRKQFRASPEAVLEFIEPHNRELHRLIAEEWKDRGSK